MRLDHLRMLRPIHKSITISSRVVWARWCFTAAVVLAVAAPSASLWAQAARSNAVSAMPTGAVTRPGDVVRISVWREPDLSGDFTVDETGTVVLPRLGPIDVSADTRMSLRLRLIRDYEAFLNHGSVTVTLLRRVQVLGAVRSPGLFNADGTMTLGDVLAQAGGITPEGDAGRVRLIRGGSRVTSDMTTQTLLSDSPVLSGDQIFVPEKRWIARYPGIAAAGITAAASLVVALTRH